MPLAADQPRRIAGIEVPRDPISAATWGLARRRLPAYLFAHSVRSYLWAAALGRDESLAFEPRILWPAALLHDIGLTRIPRNTRCFEFQGAEVARRFLVGQGMPRADAARVGLAIELHMATSVTLADGVESVLLDRATGIDVRGARAFPRDGFDRHFLGAIRREVDARPGCQSDRLLKLVGLANWMAGSPWTQASPQR